MQKYWVEAFSADWADEFEVFFFDVYTDAEKNNLNWLGEKFPNIRLDYCFGSNQSWDEDEGFGIQVNGIEATEEEVNTLYKFKICGESLSSRYYQFVYDILDEDTRNKWYETYGSLINIPEKIFQSYDFKLDNLYDYDEEDEENEEDY